MMPSEKDLIRDIRERAAELTKKAIAVEMAEGFHRCSTDDDYYRGGADALRVLAATQDATTPYVLKCRCGAICWTAGDPSITTPCSGAMNVSEDYPDIFTHYCDGHGHYEDREREFL